MNSWCLALSKTIIWISIFVFENPDPVLEIITNLLLRLKEWFCFRLCLLNLLGFSFICWALASRILRFFSSNAILIRLAASYRLKVGYFFRLSSFHWSMDSLLHGSTPLKEDGRVFILKKNYKIQIKVNNLYLTSTGSGDLCKLLLRLHSYFEILANFKKSYQND